MSAPGGQSSEWVKTPMPAADNDLRRKEIKGE